MGAVTKPVFVGVDVTEVVVAVFDPEETVLEPPPAATTVSDTDPEEEPVS